MILDIPEIAKQGESGKEREPHSPLSFRKPKLDDGVNIFELIKNCPPLDQNSVYCNFLQTSHFHNTCILASQMNKTVGFISAYIRPDQFDTLFIWQVAIDASMRGRGVAFSMLEQLLNRSNLKHIKQIETTITKNNEGSWRLFEKIDKQHGGKGKVSVFLDQKTHFKNQHDTEFLYQIPLSH